jgi:tetratricopeptide (TPR) repeat protein
VALALAAPEAVPVRTLLVAHAMMLACALPSVAVAMRVAPSRPDCAESCPLDSTHAALVQRARSASHRGDWNEAAELWRDALAIDDRLAEHWLMLGSVLTQAERHREAVAAYQRAMQLDAKLTREGTTSVARAYARLGDDRQAVRWLELALRAGVKPEEVWNDEVFGTYRHDPRLRVPERTEVKGGMRPSRERGSTV